MKRTHYRIGAIATSAVLLSAVAVPAMASELPDPSSDSSTGQDVVAIDDSVTADDSAPVDEDSVEEAPVEEAPAEEAPIDETVADDAPAIADEAPAEAAPAPIEPVVAEPAVAVAPLAVTTLHSTDKNAAGWAFGESRAFGHHEYVANGLHVWTEDDGAGLSTSKSAGYVAASFPLADAASTTINFTSYSGVRPSVQLAVDRDGNGTWDGYLVYEPWAYGDGNWWTSKAGFGVPSGMGYASFGTIDAFVAANPAARVIGVGYSLGSGVIGDAVINKIVVGGATYTFGLAPARRGAAQGDDSPLDRQERRGLGLRGVARLRPPRVHQGRPARLDRGRQRRALDVQVGRLRRGELPARGRSEHDHQLHLVLRRATERAARGRPRRQRHLGRVPRLRAVGLRQRQLVDLEGRVRRRRRAWATRPSAPSTPSSRQIPLPASSASATPSAPA